MLFNSIDFLIFFPLVCLVFFLLPFKWRPSFLLIANFYFYMGWEAKYIVLLLTSTTVTYTAGLLISRSSRIAQKRLWLTLSLVINFGILFFFKYFNFFNTSVLGALCQCLNIPYAPPAFSILLPVGISFYTFQSVAYTIDVYRGTIPVEKNIIMYTLFQSFFPQLVAGPIERTANLLPQFYEKKYFDATRAINGLKLVAWGLFKKVVVADRLAVFVTIVYSSPTDYHGFWLVMATIFFSFQIFCDFSGYTDIAIGTAQIMGFRLMDNFTRPYFAKSIPEFWRRWHISLSTWFRDYVYVPLGGNRVSQPRWFVNLFITFLVSGIWHGANWTFIIWGAYHGVLMVTDIITQRLRYACAKATRLLDHHRCHKIAQVATTYSLVCIGWIFFRASSVSDAWYILTHLGSGMGALAEPFVAGDFLTGWERLVQEIAAVGVPVREFVISLVVIACMELFHLVQRHENIRALLADKPTHVRWAWYYAIVVMILMLGKFNETQFIYFQF